MDFVRNDFGTNEPLTSWTLFSSLFDWFAVHTVQRFICTEVTSFKIRILGSRYCDSSDFKVRHKCNWYWITDVESTSPISSYFWFVSFPFDRKDWPNRLAFGFLWLILKSDKSHIPKYIVHKKALWIWITFPPQVSS